VTERSERGTLQEPTLKPAPSLTEHRIERGLRRAASLLGGIVALLMLALVVVALLGVVGPVLQASRSGDFGRAAVAGLDSAFLAIIILELVHTTLSRGPVSRQVQEFLVVGITSGVRTGLEVAAESGPSDRVANSLAMNALAVLLLAGALWLVRQRLQAERAEASAAEPDSAS
jgi:hypothetical protein